MTEISRLQQSQQAGCPVVTISRARCRRDSCLRLGTAARNERGGANPRAAGGAHQDADEPDESVIEAMLTADADQTIMVWEERGLPLDLLSTYGAGVQLHVEDLADHLAGRERRDDAKARWDELTLPTRTWPLTSARKPSLASSGMRARSDITVRCTFGPDDRSETSTIPGVTRRLC